MAEYDIGPSFVKLEYHSVFGAHVHLIPCREWNSVSIGGAMGSFENWNATNIDAEDMIDTLCVAMQPVHLNTSLIDTATIFTKPTPDAPSIPVASKAINLPGTSGLATHSKAIGAQFTFRTDAFHPSKLVFLDVPHDASEFDKETYFTTDPTNQDLADVFMNDIWAWCGRDGAQPTVLISVTWNLNQALRKQYNMA